MNSALSNSRNNAYMASLLVIFQGILFPAALIYLGNVAFFSSPLMTVLLLAVFLGVALLLLLLIVLRFSRESVMPHLTVALAALSILLWIQGSLLVRDLGVLDGTMIDWDSNEGGFWIDYAVWLASALGFVLLWRVGKSRMVLQLALILFALQSATIVYQLATAGDGLRKGASTYSAEKIQSIADFSRSENIVHIVMDAFQADVFEELVYSDAYRDYYQKSFDGFTYYREAMGVFPRTKFSVPAFLSGKAYDNSVASGFVESALQGKNTVSLAAENGFAVDIVADGSYLIDKYGYLPHERLLDVNDLPVLGRRMQESALLLDLAVFRVLPAHLKKRVYNGQKWRFSSVVKGENEFLMYEYFTNAVFLMEFFNRMVATRDEPVYKYIHLFSTHGPKVVGPDCQYAGEVFPHTRDTYTFMANCALNSLAQILNRMKDLGIYDDALIVFHADHGGWIPNKRQPRDNRELFYKVPSEEHARILPDTIRAAASPLLAIKFPGATGGVRTSNALASLLDIPDTMSDAMSWGEGFGHVSLLRLPENQLRRRVFRYYNREKNSEASDHTGPMADYVIEGSHYEAPWRLDRILMPRDGDSG